MTTFNRFIDLLIDRIISFTDYFIVKQHITLSETGLFGLGLIRGFWPLMFGAPIVYDNPILTATPISLSFAVLSTLHFVSFFFTTLRFRIAIVCLYALVWCFLAILFAATVFASLGGPIFGLFALVSLFIAVRLIREMRP